MSFIKAKNYLKKYVLDNEIMEFDVSSATVKEAAIAIGCLEDEIAKSLAFIVGEKPILVIVSGNSKISNSKFKKEFKVKAKMIPSDDVGKIIGHVAGGVCPFGINKNIDVYLDETLKKYKIVYPACGSSNSAVKLELGELEKVSNYKKWVDVCK
ncbi:MAG: YbaK/EbsC family protein [Bacilli bacterium]|nr:YbaK/EbsC family protein [Bacilli bacterium]